MSAARPQRGPSAPAWWTALRARFAGGEPSGERVPIRDWVGATPAQPSRALGFDQALVWVVMALLLLGLVMVYSASVALPDNPKFARYSPTHFLSRHALSLAIAVVKALAGVQITISFWEK